MIRVIERIKCDFEGCEETAVPEDGTVGPVVLSFHRVGIGRSRATVRVDLCKEHFDVIEGLYRAGSRVQQKKKTGAAG